MLNDVNSLVLVDFGLALRFENDDDIIKGTAGTVKFYAPEVVRTGVKNKVVRAR